MVGVRCRADPLAGWGYSVGANADACAAAALLVGAHARIRVIRPSNDGRALRSRRCCGSAHSFGAQRGTRDISVALAKARRCADDLAAPRGLSKHPCCACYAGAEANGGPDRERAGDQQLCHRATAPDACWVLSARACHRRLMRRRHGDLPRSRAPPAACAASVVRPRLRVRARSRARGLQPPSLLPSWHTRWEPTAANSRCHLASSPCRLVRKPVRSGTRLGNRPPSQEAL